MIRQFAREDLKHLHEMGRLMHQESSYSHLDYDVEKLTQLAYSCVEYPKEYLGIVYEEEGEIVGMFIGYITPFFFSNQSIASDLVLYVKKEKRGGAAAVKLIKTYEKWATLGGASQIMLGVSTGVEQERTAELYKQLGFKESGIIFKKESEV